MCPRFAVVARASARSSGAASTRRSAKRPAPPRTTHLAPGIQATTTRGLSCRLVMPRDEGKADASNGPPASMVIPDAGSNDLERRRSRGVTERSKSAACRDRRRRVGPAGEERVQVRNAPMPWMPSVVVPVTATCLRLSPVSASASRDCVQPCHPVRGTADRACCYRRSRIRNPRRRRSPTPAPS